MTYFQIGEDRLSIHIDTYGNLYFEHNHKLFQLNVDKNNRPYFESGEYNIIEEGKRYRNFGKIIKLSKLNDSKYFVEENEYSFIRTNDDIYAGEEYADDIDRMNNPPFEFYKSDEYDIEIAEREFGQIDALYDIFIYEENNTKTNKESKLVFRSELPHEFCTYRVCIASHCKFYFRSHGMTTEHSYEIVIENDNIIVKENI
jgi:hypothetical protein